MLTGYKDPSSSGFTPFDKPHYFTFVLLMKVRPDLRRISRTMTFWNTIFTDRITRYYDYHIVVLQPEKNVCNDFLDFFSVHVLAVFSFIFSFRIPFKRLIYIGNFYFVLSILAVLHVLRIRTLSANMLDFRMQIFKYQSNTCIGDIVWCIVCEITRGN